MNLISYNNKYVLFSDDKMTYLLDVVTFQVKETLQMTTKIGYLQYGTGIAALVCQSKVRIYDFIFKRDVYDFESFLKIQKLSLLKNLLIVISAERILIHDLKLKTNQCYIPIQCGDLAIISKDYYTLRIAYYLQTHLLANRQIWLNKVNRIEGVKYQHGAYSPNGEIIALALKNVLSLYQNQQLIKVFGFDFQIEQLVSLQQYFFVKLADGKIIGCGEHNQVHFLQCQQILLEFWNHQYETVIFCNDNALFEMGKGLIKKYHLDRAQICNLSQQKRLRKQSKAVQSSET